MRARTNTRARRQAARVHHAGATVVDAGRVLVGWRTGTYAEFTPSEYVRWRTRTRGTTLIVAQRVFVHEADVLFEDTLNPTARTFDSWMRDHLAAWVWRTHKTGILTPHERVDALLTYMATDGPWAAARTLPPVPCPQTKL